jgi:Flp pilus assembly protein TadG
MVVLLVFAGFAIDLGVAYMTKATLSKALDAAALTAARNISQGESTAQTLAQSAFAANYGAATPLPTVTFSDTTPSCPAGPSGQTQVCVNATATVNTKFLSIVPQWKTLSVASSASALRADAAVTMVLDRSGSMNLNGGCSALPVAVTDFVGYFDTSRDKLGMAGFASNASADASGTCQGTDQLKGYCVPPTSSFSNITTAVGNWDCNGNGFGGGTYAQGGLLNGQTWENAITTANVRKAVVFFTDGWANANQDSFPCGPGGSPITLTYGGCSPVEAGVFPETDGTTYLNPAWCTPNPNGTDFWTSSPGNVNQTSFANCNASTFPAQKPGNGNAISNSSSTPSGVTTWITGTRGTTTAYYIAQDAEYRALQLANTMRGQGIIVYSVGLGSMVDSAFLQQLANDPNYTATYNSSQPAGTSGLAVFAPDCPGTGSECTDELKRAFQIIANDILLRLTQ